MKSAIGVIVLTAWFMYSTAASAQYGFDPSIQQRTNEMMRHQEQMQQQQREMLQREHHHQERMMQQQRQQQSVDRMNMQRLAPLAPLGGY